MKLPNGNKTEISMQKLVEYCLNPDHASGKHKAKVFASALVITVDNVEVFTNLFKQQPLKEMSFKRI
ncbi:MAG: DUF6883 domain-containing protein [Cyanobacteria bacterium P01_G01_bin.39]